MLIPTLISIGQHELEQVNIYRTSIDIHPNCIFNQKNVTLCLTVSARVGD
jgi:hypothetical protein